MLLSRHVDGGTSSKVKYCFMSDFGNSMGVSWFEFSWCSSYSSASNWTVDSVFSGVLVEVTTSAIDCVSCNKDWGNGCGSNETPAKGLMPLLGDRGEMLSCRCSKAVRAGNSCSYSCEYEHDGPLVIGNTGDKINSLSFVAWVYVVMVVDLALLLGTRHNSQISPKVLQEFQLLNTFLIPSFEFLLRGFSLP
uniref:Uncharacterized protein n=1 Tax=Tanacetum cinerariifolium TaxID=118510 RepID=A0A699JSS1_TANCI|nr:hypothetical protein [Tanacetum cinerariifolium]